MSESPQDRRSQFRAAIQQFLRERLEGKLDKLGDDDPKRAELLVQFAPEAWLADAAKRVAQIQTVTHSLKPIHPEARGTNLYCPPASLVSRPEVGSHVLGADFAGDVVGNAAALDVHKFLRVVVEGRPLLVWLQQADADAVAHRLAVAEHEVEIGVRGVDDDRARGFAGRIVHDLATQALVQLVEFEFGFAVRFEAHGAPPVGRSV